MHSDLTLEDLTWVTATGHSEVFELSQSFVLLRSALITDLRQEILFRGATFVRLCKSKNQGEIEKK